MLPRTYDVNPIYSFIRDDQRLCMLLVSEELKQKARNPQAPAEPLWVGTCGNRESLEAMIRWLRVRRKSWQGWGRMAETLGRDLLATHMSKLLAEDPPARSLGTLVTLGEDERDLALGDTVSTADGIGKDTLYVHRFDSAESRKSFMAWFSDGNSHNVDAMIELALDYGTDRLGAALDEIAAKEMPAMAARLNSAA